MSLSVLCKKCGEQVTVPDSYGRPKKVRCPECDAVCEVGATSEDEPAVKRVRGTVIARPKPKSAAEITNPQRERGNNDDDDERPYELPPDPEPKEPCPHCRKSVPLGAVVCSECGFNRETGAILQRVFTKVAREWQTGLAVHVRLGIFVSLVTFTLSVAAFFVIKQEGNAVVLLLVWIAGALLLSFLLGTFPRLKLTRSKKGQVRLTKTWRVCFIPWKPDDINLRGYEGVSVYPHHKADGADFAVFIMLLIFGVFPGILWWIFIIQPDQYDVALTRDHGTPALLLYRGRNDETARNIADSIRKVTDLK